MNLRREAFFLSSSGGQRFCIYYPAINAESATSRGYVIYIHPLAEEMNKARRMAALQARALAAAGYDVLQIDLFGCGDSAGDFGGATWAGWVADVVHGCQWLHGHTNIHAEHQPSRPIWLWGLRAGCLLATQVAAQLSVPCNFIFWAPSTSGKVLLQQFLRLKAAGNMQGGSVKGVTETLRQQLASGNAVEVTGYALSPALAHGLENASLDPPQCFSTIERPARLEWFELSTRDDAVLSPVAAKTGAMWSKAGFNVHAHVVRGPSFWQTSETEEAPELIAATVAVMAAFQQPTTA